MITKSKFKPTADIIRQVANPLRDSSDLDSIIDYIGDARFVLLGEASHGTSDYYLWRARLSQRLIQEKGFSFIAVEGDWPDCYRINRYIKGYEAWGSDAPTVLKEFERWPSWMWANWEIVALVEWLKNYNGKMPDAKKVGFYGLDVYSLWESLAEIMHYLEGMSLSRLRRRIVPIIVFSLMARMSKLMPMQAASFPNPVKMR